MRPRISISSRRSFTRSPARVPLAQTAWPIVVDERADGVGDAGGDAGPDPRAHEGGGEGGEADHDDQPLHGGLPGLVADAVAHMKLGDGGLECGCTARERLDMRSSSLSLVVRVPCGSKVRSAPPPVNGRRGSSFAAPRGPSGPRPPRVPRALSTSRTCVRSRAVQRAPTRQAVADDRRRDVPGARRERQPEARAARARGGRSAPAGRHRRRSAPRGSCVPRRPSRRRRCTKRPPDGTQP